MREIITKFSRTGEVDGRLTRNGIYADKPNFDDHDHEELSRMDIYERREVAAELEAAREQQLQELEEQKLKKEKESKTFSKSTTRVDGAPDPGDQGTKETGSKERHVTKTEATRKDGNKK